MKNFWLLPDVDQSGEIKVLRNGTVTTLRNDSEFPLRQLPNSFILGIPESVLRENPDEDFIFAQYAKLDKKNNIFACSIRANKDISGRTVFLTNIKITSSNEHIITSLEIDDGIDDKSVLGRMRDTSNIFEKKLNESGSNIQLMFTEINNPRYKTFASEDLPMVANKPQWTPKKKSIRLQLMYR